MRNTLLLSFLALGLLATPSYAVVVDLTMEPPSSSANTIKFTIDLASSLLNDHQNATSYASGNMLANLVYDFDPSNPQHPTLETMAFTGGLFSLSDVSLSINKTLVRANANSSGLGGTFTTPSPPAPVTDGTHFNAEDHEAIINQGSMNIKAEAFALFSWTTVYQETMNFSPGATPGPMTGTSPGPGTIETTCTSVSGNNYTFEVSLTLPMKITEHGVENVDIIGDLTYDITAEGDIVAKGYFTQEILPLNIPPVADNDSYRVHLSDVLNVDAPGVLANDDDPDGNNSLLTAAKASNPTHGDLTFGSDGGFTYDPDTNFRGIDTFTYRASDGIDSSAAATVTIEVYNNAPTVADDAYEFNAADNFLDVTALDGILTNDEDEDEDFFSPTIQDNVDNGYLSLRMDGSFFYVPNTGFSGIDTFTYKATDGWDTSDIATVTIKVNPIVVDIPGDANRDGRVDGSDVTILAGNWQRGVTGTADATWDMGDFNADGKVDGSDVTILAGNWQAGVTAAATAVPEPGMLALLLGAIASLALIRRKR